MASKSLVTTIFLSMLLTTALCHSTNPVASTTLRQLSRPRRFRLNQAATERLCQRSGCELTRCFRRRRTGTTAPIRGFRCRVSRTSPLPTPTAPPTGRILLCNIDKQLLLTVRTTLNGVRGVLVFRTYGQAFDADRQREAMCLQNGSAGISISNAIRLSGPGCVPQQTCKIRSGGRCTCLPETMFCLRTPISNALEMNCPAPTLID